MKRFLIVAFSAFALVGCSTGAAASSPSPEAFDVRGMLTLNQVSDNTSKGDACTGRDGYDDIREGAQVKVSSDAGKVLGLGALKAGRAGQPLEDTGATGTCVFGFEVSGIPAGGGAIFGVEVTHRGVIQFTRDEAGTIALTLGS